MANEHELKVVRDRQAALNARIDRAEGAPATRAARCLVQVYDGGNLPSQADRVYLTHPVELDGEEAEGGAASLNVDQSTTVPVVVLWGPARAGDVLTAHAVGGRWVSERQGTSLSSVLCGNCQVPRSLYLTDAHTTTLLTYVEPAPSWIVLETGAPWPCSGAWVGCYSLPDQLVGSGCVSTPSHVPYNGGTPIRYALGFCGAHCTLDARRVWGTTNVDGAPSGFAYVDCASGVDCGATSTNCPESACNAVWQTDTYFGLLPSCAPFPWSVALNASKALPGNPLGPSIVIDA